jgi:hypothetical protein
MSCCQKLIYYFIIFTAENIFIDMVKIGHRSRFGILNLYPFQE